VVIRVWDRYGRLGYISTTAHVRPAAARPGDATLTGNDDTWRVYLAERGVANAHRATVTLDDGPAGRGPTLPIVHVGAP
jgi:hypothetical protein